MIHVDLGQIRRAWSLETAVPTDCRAELAGMVTAMQVDEARSVWTLLGKYANSHPALFIDLACDMVADLDARIAGATA